MTDLLAFLRDFLTVLWAMRLVVIPVAFGLLVLLWYDEVTRARRAERLVARLWQENDELRRALGAQRPSAYQPGPTLGGLL